ncbi:hypothetical protein EOM39_06715 [Candidatus Gracilibacteria bacterium]|nr:hypothetical protein [Candidatus Gracilibacteria bacterium]
MPIGLSKGGQLFMPLYNKDYYAVGYIIISRDLKQAVAHKVLLSTVGVAGAFAYEKPDEIYIVKSVLDMMFLFQEGYDNVILIPEFELGLNSILLNFHKRILISYDEDIVTNSGLSYYCTYLDEYKGGKLPAGEPLFSTDYVDINTNPFVINGELFFAFYKSTGIINCLSKKNSFDLLYNKSYNKFSDDAVKSNSWIGTYKGNTIFFHGRYIFPKGFIYKEVDEEEIRKTLELYLKTKLFFLNTDQARIIALYIMYLYIHPHFSYYYNLLMYVTNISWKMIINIEISNLLPHWEPDDSLPAIKLLSGDKEKIEPRILYRNAPGIFVAGIDYSEIYTAGIPLILDGVTGCRNFRRPPFNKESKTLIRNSLINFALNYEPRLVGVKQVVKHYNAWDNIFSTVLNTPYEVNRTREYIVENIKRADLIGKRKFIPDIIDLSPMVTEGKIQKRTKSIIGRRKKNEK